MSFVSHFSTVQRFLFWQLQLSRSLSILSCLCLYPGAKHADLLVFSAGWLDHTCYLCSLRFKRILLVWSLFSLSKGTEPLLSFGIPFNIICLWFHSLLFIATLSNLLTVICKDSKKSAKIFFAKSPSISLYFCKTLLTVSPVFSQSPMAACTVKCCVSQRTKGNQWSTRTDGERAGFRQFFLLSLLSPGLLCAQQRWPCLWRIPSSGSFL